MKRDEAGGEGRGMMRGGEGREMRREEREEGGEGRGIMRGGGGRRRGRVTLIGLMDVCVCVVKQIYSRKYIDQI